LRSAASCCGNGEEYQRQSLRYQIELTDSIYYRNVNNNAGS
jgi:hypothetical protein